MITKSHHWEGGVKKMSHQPKHDPVKHGFCHPPNSPIVTYLSLLFTARRTTPIPSIDCSYAQPQSLDAWSVMRRRRKRTILIALPTLFLLSFLYVFFNVGMKSLFPASANKSLTLGKEPHSKAKSSILIGILTRPDSYHRRHFLRLVYGIQKTSVADIDVKFVFCNLTKPEQRAFIALEILRFDDIIILNCTENMNSGKTYTYFSSLPSILSRRYDYVMKADDDVYIRLEPLSLSLRSLPKQDLYYGFVIPCNSMNPFVDYMSGMGFLLSWDLVEWIGSSGVFLANDTYGPEDKTVGKWLKMGKKAKNRFSNKPAMYDYPGTNGRCSHELIPETVAVHRLKRWDQWLHVLEFFNVTKQLKPSDLYRLLL